jgi:osmoprotectant transport system ATP-binding protein
VPGTASDPPIVQFRSVTHAYGERLVLKGLDVSVARGESLALVGRSGAGKSTLLKLINRLLLPQSGAVLVEGRDTREWDPVRLRRRTGYVLQEIGLFPHLTVEQNVRLVPRLEGWTENRQRERAHELLNLVGLAPLEFGARWPRELSGGQRQRVGVARALAIAPPVLVMDEPLGALDPITRVEVQAVIQRVRRELGQTLFLVTHDIAEASALGSRIGVLEDGCLIACDTPAAIARSQDPRVRRFLDAVPALTERVAGAAPSDPDAAQGPAPSEGKRVEGCV